MRVEVQEEGGQVAIPDKLQYALGGDHSPRPHGNCYWLVPGLILAGEYPRTKEVDESRTKLAAIIDAGVREFVDLTEHGELTSYEGLLAGLGAERSLEVGYTRLPIQDVSIPAPGRMREILDCVHANLTRSRPVYIHCWGGIGRTGTVAGCLLVEAGFKPAEAIEMLARKWTVVEKRHDHRRSPETDEQFAFIRNWRPSALASR